MAAEKDYYDILGVSRHASSGEIKRAYRKLAKKYHPDRNRNTDTEEQFKQVQRVYDTLKDATKRKEYDQYGEVGVGQWQTDPGGQQVYQWGSNSSINVNDLEDIFSAFSGQSQDRPSIFEQFSRQGRHSHNRHSHPTRGRDELKDVMLTWDQAINGATVTVRLDRSTTDQTESLEVKIPPGITNSQKIRLRGRGHPGMLGGAAGDFILVCRVQPHLYFTTQDCDVFLDVPISVPEAVLGVKVEIPTLTGKTLLTIPAGTRPSAKLRLRGMGLRKADNKENGDFFAVVQIQWPSDPSPTQRNLYQELLKHDEPSARSKLGWWGK